MFRDIRVPRFSPDSSIIHILIYKQTRLKFTSEVIGLVGTTFDVAPPRSGLILIFFGLILSSIYIFSKTVPVKDGAVGEQRTNWLSRFEFEYALIFLKNNRLFLKKKDFCSVGKSFLAKSQQLC